MKILVVAPEHHDLPNAAVEIAAINRFHEATILPGQVRDSDIATAVEDGPYDVVWFVTHGSSEGVLLSDGWLSIEGVGQYLRTSRATLCILNTCASEQVALAIVAGGQADIICTIAPVDNRDAIRLGSLLAGELAHADSYLDAYEIVAPPGGLYRYLRAGRQYRRRGGDEQININELMQVIAGDRFGQPGLVRRTEAMESRLVSVEKRLGTVEESLGDVQSELVDLKQILKDRVDQNQIHIGRGVAVVFGLAFIAAAVMAGLALWYLGSGGHLDGSVGSALPALCSLSNYCNPGF